MTQKELKQWITRLIQENKIYKFYKSKEWIKLRNEILFESHYECAKCKARGKISKAVTVHHVQHVRKYPELALSKTYIFKGKEYKNLIPLCHDCHDEEHERMKYKKKKHFNEERW
ncbi:MAG: HNH endonuclease [Agathobacter sp.]